MNFHEFFPVSFLIPFNFQNHEIHSCVATLPSGSVSSQHEQRLTLTLEFQAVTTKKNPPWFKLTKNLLKWVFTSAFQLSVHDNNTIHSFKQCLCLGLLKLSHWVRKRVLPWATRQREVMKNYNLIVPIKDSFTSKQGLKQSSTAFPGKGRWGHQMPLCMTAMLCGLPSCWQLQENPHRHAEQTSTELHKI